MAPTPEISCVIPCYHRPELLRPLVSKLDDPRIEIVVVNSEADPEVAEVAERFVHVPRESSGFASGVNLGAKHVSADYVVFMNDDVLIEVDGILALLEEMASRRADAVVPAIVDPQGLPEVSIRPLPTPLALFREWFLLPERPPRWLQGRIRVEKWRRPVGAETIKAAGTPMIATRTDLLREMPLSEDYFLNWDEIEWFWRIHERGMKVLFLPSVEAIHLGGGHQELSPLRSRLMTTNAVRCVRRTQGRPAARRAFAVMFLYNVRLVAIALLRRAMPGGRGSGAELEARLAGLRATKESWGETK
jgi:GT2 family glycosyltransferase